MAIPLPMHNGAEANSIIVVTHFQFRSAIGKFILISHTKLGFFRLTWPTLITINASDYLNYFLYFFEAL